MKIYYYKEWEYVQKGLNIDVDGMPGGETLRAVSTALKTLELWTAVQTKVGTDADGEPGRKTAVAVAGKLGITLPVIWPTQAEVRSGKSMFGKAGDEGNLVSVALPYPMRLSWELKTTVKTMRVHKCVAGAVKRIFEKTLEHYGLEGVRKLRLDVFGGSYNNRTIVGGKATSMHAYGIAIDIDPDANTYDMRYPKAFLSGKEYEAFWSFVEAEGGVSLGRERDYDWMHFQFASF